MNRYFAVLERINNSNTQTMGVITLFRDSDVLGTYRTLELGWHENTPNISCIPKGQYEVIPYSSKKYPKAFHVLDVPERSNILIHNGNFYTDIRGCILVGKEISDINNDGFLDVTQSMSALGEIIDKIGQNKFTLYIV